MIRIEKNFIKRLATGAISLLVALAVWLIVSLIVNSEFLFPSPALVFKEVGVYLVTPVFYAALFSTLIKILVSFFIGKGKNRRIRALPVRRYRSRRPHGKRGFHLSAVVFFARKPYDCRFLSHFSRSLFLGVDRHTRC